MKQLYKHAMAIPSQASVSKYLPKKSKESMQVDGFIKGYCSLWAIVSIGKQND